MDPIPYLTERPVLVTYETQYAFHRRYADEMRRRMRCVVDACFATNPVPLIRLRDELGVTHFVGSLHLYDGRPKSYPFKPYAGWVHEATRKPR